VNGALIRFRIIAYVVGVVLLLLVGVAMPVKYIGGDPSVVETVGPIHGFLYIVYLVLAFDLARRARWSLRRTVLVLLAGTVPFLSFVAERKATSWVRNPDGDAVLTGA
jgi:integral membrane protein